LPVYNFLKICHIDFIFAWGLRGLVWGLSLLEIAENHKIVAKICGDKTALYRDLATNMIKHQ
jgi:hypothetical protein